MNVLMRPTERPRQNAGPRADARGTRPMNATRSTRLIQNEERQNEMNWKKILEALYGFLGALIGALAGAGCSLLGSGVGVTCH